MAKEFETTAAHCVSPGTVTERDGVVFSKVFRDTKDCGVILYHLPDLREVKVPFPGEYRCGSLYSMKIRGLDPSEWGYRYYRDDEIFEDPYAREVLSVKLKDGPANICKLFPYPEEELPFNHNGEKSAWSDRVIYVCHAKGFTASKTSRVQHRGTFAGIMEKIPYLKKIGVTAIELLPCYELFPQTHDLSIEELVLSGHDSVQDAKEQAGGKDNYWNFGTGRYFAPKRSYSCGEPQKEFLELVQKLHENGIYVYLQMFFSEQAAARTQLQACRFYVTHYQVDGFHLKGDIRRLDEIASDPLLADTDLFYYDFPYEDLQKEDRRNIAAGKPSIRHLCEYRDTFEKLARKFVKSDDNVLRPFVKEFVTVPAEHGAVHYVTNYEGFTLNDLVSYNYKHNEENGENNQDGANDNDSWNCGVEGPSFKREIRFLRNRQMRNFMALNLLAQGTPVITAGDERCNSQGGNNNVYCQDNETGWMNWRETVDGKELLNFTEKMTQFRKEHAVFRMRVPFKFSDYRSTGFPDVSFHGREAWKPDFAGYSHTVGVLYNEEYAPENPTKTLVYVAINMHWHNQQLAVPSVPAGYRWRVVMDTFEEPAFLTEPELLKDQRHVFVKGRSVRILIAKKEFEPEKAAKGTAGKKASAGKKAADAQGF